MAAFCRYLKVCCAIMAVFSDGLDVVRGTPRVSTKESSAFDDRFANNTELTSV
jgi:hypothetical protein